MTEKIPLLVLSVIQALDILLEVASVKDYDFMHILHDPWAHTVYRLEIVASFGALGTWRVE